MLQCKQTLFVLWLFSFDVVNICDKVVGTIEFIPAASREIVLAKCDEVLQKEVLLEISCYVVHNIEDRALLNG